MFEIRTAVTENRMSRAELAALGITPQRLPELLCGRGHGWVVEDAERILAFAMADADDATVFALFVRPGHDGQGFGRRLIAVAEGWLADQGCVELWLLTDADRQVRANGFYRHLGWREAGLQPDGQMRFVKRLPQGG